MNEPVKNMLFPVPRYRIWKSALIVIKKKEYRLIDTNDEGHLLVPVDRPETTERFTHTRFYELMEARKIDVHQFFFAGGRKKRPTEFESKRVVDLPDKAQFRVIQYQAMLDAFLRRKVAAARDKTLEKVQLSDASLRRVLPLIKAELEPKKGQAGSVRTSVTMPSPRQFRRLLARYQESGYDPMSLAKFSASKTKRLELHLAQDIQIWNQFAHEYASPLKPFVTDVHKALVAHIVQLNDKRVEQNLRLHTIPSYKQFLKLVKSLNTFWVTAAREGKEAANKLFRITYGNHEVERPGEVVEFDEWTVDLITWFSWAKLLEFLSAEELAAIKKVRLRVIVGIDVATKCIATMRFSTAAATEKTMIDAIEMMVSDKSRLAKLAGANSSWPYHMLAETAVADNGGALAAFGVRAVFSALETQYMHPPAGMPWLRGSIEAVFKTFGGQFLAWFEGRTFSDIFTRGDYKSEERVSLSIDQLNLLLVQAIVDIYHHQPHSTTGQTPHERWLRLSEKYGVLPPPPAKVRRAIFGTRMNREITDQGVTIFGIHYQSKLLQQFRMDSKSSILVRVDRFNLDAISGWNGEGWFTIPATIRIPEDVSLWEWVGAAREVEADNAPGTERGLASMLAAVNRLRLSGAAASARAGIATAPIDEESLLKAHTNYFDNMAYIDDLGDVDPELAPLLLASDPLMTGIAGIDDQLTASSEPDPDFPAAAIFVAAPTTIRSTSDIKI
ncbi:hypothetical protein QTL95_18335 [Rhizobium sp. S152]|uniref:hypothetical protein n=1 Tax=Rhizobium sp. S152 TaxID=3055038 RepID=UPI0025AA25C8|nr:hypothetical protein [Rhizobium sp. S152]MDM9627853.1 hypothetical protein [Rhizobium sp. S152]